MEHEEGFVYEEIQLPQALWDKIDKLAHYAGLTTSQMAQAIITLQFNATGWFNNPKENG